MCLPNVPNLQSRRKRLGEQAASRVPPAHSTEVPAGGRPGAGSQVPQARGRGPGGGRRAGRVALERRARPTILMVRQQRRSQVLREGPSRTHQHLTALYATDASCSPAARASSAAGAEKRPQVRLSSSSSPNPASEDKVAADACVYRLLSFPP